VTSSFRRVRCAPRSKETLVFCDEWLKVFVLDALAEEVVTQELDLSEDECTTLGIEFESIPEPVEDMDSDAEAKSEAEAVRDAAGVDGNKDRAEETNLIGGAPSGGGRRRTARQRVA
jgi:hypothetical protein